MAGGVAGAGNALGLILGSYYGGQLANKKRQQEFENKLAALQAKLQEQDALKQAEFERVNRMTPEQQQVYLQLYGKGFNPLNYVASQLVRDRTGAGSGFPGGMPSISPQPNGSGLPQGGQGGRMVMADPNAPTPSPMAGSDPLAGATLLQDEAGNQFFQLPNGQLLNIDGSPVQ